MSHIAPSYQVVGSENHSALSRDPDQVRPSCSSFCEKKKKKNKKMCSKFVTGILKATFD